MSLVRRLDAAKQSGKEYWNNSLRKYIYLLLVCCVSAGREEPGPHHQLLDVPGQATRHARHI